MAPKSYQYITGMEPRRSYDPLWGLSWTGVISTGQRRSERVCGGGCFRHATLRGPLGLNLRVPLAGFVAWKARPMACRCCVAGWWPGWPCQPDGARSQCAEWRLPLTRRRTRYASGGKKVPGGWRAYDALHGCGCDLPLFKFVTHRRTMIFTPCGMILPDVTIW